MSSLSVKKTAFSFRVRAFGGARAFVEVVAVSSAGGGHGHFVALSPAGGGRGHFVALSPAGGGRGHFVAVSPAGGGRGHFVYMSRARSQSLPRLSYTTCWAHAGVCGDPRWGRCQAPCSALPGAFGGAASSSHP